MLDDRETVADRLERAADRMSNSGFLEEERRIRNAVTRIRAGLSYQETRKLEQKLLLDPQPDMLYRLSALAAAGEYDTDDGDDVDMDFISDREGGQQLNAYVPDPTSSKSGVTVATGVDLGQLSATDLDAMDIPQTLKDQLQPYVGLKQQDAVDYLQQHPLQLSQDDAQALDDAVLKPIINQLQSNFDKDTTGTAFSQLPSEAQTVIASVATQYGANMGYPPGPGQSAPAPKFWNDVTTGDWNGAVAELRDFGDNYQSRHNIEANLLQQAIDSGALPGKK
jgi:hypothetical protein